MPAPPSRDLLVRFSALASVTDTDPEWHEARLSDLLEVQVVDKKEDAPLFSFAEWSADRPAGQRLDRGVLRVHHLVYDLDRPHPPIDPYALDGLRGRLAGLAGAIYTTFRHLVDHPRYRLVLLCDRPIPAADYRRAWRAALQHYQLPVGDQKSQNESRAYYAPSAAPDRARHASVEYLDGAPLSWESLSPAPPAARPFAAAAAQAGPILRAPRPGHRNQELFRYACSLRRRGLSESEIEPVVAVRNASLSDPLDPDEVAALCRSATRYDPDPALMDAQRAQDERVGAESLPPLEVGDHVEVARLELAELGWREQDGDPLVVGDQGALYYYDHGRGIWERCLPEHLRARADQYSGRDVQRPGLTKAGEPYAPAPLKVTHPFARGVAATMVDLAHRPGWLDGRPSGVAFSNGFFAPEGGEVAEYFHDPCQRQQYRHPFPYHPEPRAPLWDRFLTDLDLSPAVVSYLHEYLGACLVGDVARYKTCLVLSGTGDNGKSVLLDVVQACFPPGAIASVRPSDWGRRFVLSSLVDAQLNVVDEVPAARIQDADVFKAVISGGRVRGERKYEGAFEFRPRCGHLFACNELPRSLDRTEGFFTRWGIVPLTRRFAAHEMDHQLTEKLMTEVPQVASRLVQAAAALQARGRLEVPQVVSRARDEWRAQSDHALRFAMELEPAPGAQTETQELYRVFVRWCESDERLPRDEVPSLKSFGRAMARAGHQSAPKSAGRAAWQVRRGPFSGMQ